MTRLPLLAVPLFLVVGAASGGTAGLLWAVLCLFLTSGLSLIYLVHLARSGKVRDPRRIPQSERVGPLRTVATLHAGAFVLVSLLGAPAELRAVMFSYVLATLLFALLTPVTNLSLHAAGISGAAVCLIYLFGPLAWIPALSIPPVVWARTILRRHTPIELALGILVGGGGTWLAFFLLN